jgi:hypothetical protein
VTGARVLDEVAHAAEDGPRLLAAAEAWLRAESPLVDVIAVRLVSGPQAGRGLLAVERRAPRGSTLAEVIAGHGPLDESQAALLLLELSEGLARCHDAGLAVGAVGPTDLYLSPPGGEGRPALCSLGAGRVVLAALAGAKGQAAWAGTGSAPPESREAGTASPESDVFALATTAAWALLGRPPAGSEAGDTWVLEPETERRLQARAPLLAPAICRGLAPAAEARRGALGELRLACEAVLGDRARSLVWSRGGEPWAIGSPLVSLAAYARATPWAERRDSSRGPAGFDQAQGPEPPAGGLPREERARMLAAALRDLDVSRTRAGQAARSEQGRGLRVLALLAVLGLLGLLALLGLSRYQALERRLDLRTAPPPSRVAPPALPRPRDLYEQTSPR